VHRNVIIAEDDNVCIMLSEIKRNAIKFNGSYLERKYLLSQLRRTHILSKKIVFNISLNLF